MSVDEIHTYEKAMVSHLAAFSNIGKIQFNGRELNMRDMGTLTYGGSNDLFRLDELTLESGIIYGLVGPNGTGKSSFTKLLVSKTIPGFPQQISTMYVEASGAHVANADLDVRAYLHAAAEQRTKTLEDQISVLEESLENDDLDAEDLEALSNKIGSLWEILDELSSTLQAQIEKSLQEFGFTSSKFETKPVRHLSCGWRYKVNLICALIARDDLVVIDEPSFLDQRSKDFMVSQLKEMSLNGSVVILVSHKDELHQRLSERILYIAPTRVLRTYRNSFETFQLIREDLKKRAEREIELGEKNENQAKQSLSNMRKDFRVAAKNTRKTSNTQSMKFKDTTIFSRSKEKAQRRDKTLASKLKRAEKERERMKTLEEDTKEYDTICRVPIEGDASWENERMIALQDVSFSYDPLDTDFVFHKVSAAIYGRDRISLVGRNGEGKSTLLKLLVGELEPTSGGVNLSNGLRVAYFGQDALQTIVEAHGEQSATEYLSEVTGMSKPEARNHLGRFGLRNESTLHPIKTLSAGERSRLVLSGLFCNSKNKPSLLIVDEMENIDKETTTEILRSIVAFKGAVIYVSHDDSFHEHLKPLQRWRLDSGKFHTEVTEHFALN